MSYTKRLNIMIENGMINKDQAEEFEQSFSALSLENKKTPQKLKFIIGLIGGIISGFLITQLILNAQENDQSITTKNTVQNVSDILNQATAIGDAGVNFTNSAALIIVIGSIFAAISYFIIAQYDKIVNLNEEVIKTNTFINNAIKRRLELLPELKSLVNQVMVFEENLQSTIAEQRFKNALNNITDIETEISPLFSAIVENYPQLKTNNNIEQLQHNLNNIEYDILIARNINASALADLNSNKNSIFGSISAKIAGI